MSSKMEPVARVQAEERNHVYAGAPSGCAPPDCSGSQGLLKREQGSRPEPGLSRREGFGSASASLGLVARQRPLASKIRHEAIAELQSPPGWNPSCCRRR